MRILPNLIYFALLFILLFISVNAVDTPTKRRREANDQVAGRSPKQARNDLSASYASQMQRFINAVRDFPRFDEPFELFDTNGFIIWTAWNQLNETQINLILDLHQNGQYPPLSAKNTLIDAFTKNYHLASVNLNAVEWLVVKRVSQDLFIPWERFTSLKSLYVFDAAAIDQLQDVDLPFAVTSLRVSDNAGRSPALGSVLTRFCATGTLVSLDLNIETLSAELLEVTEMCAQNPINSLGLSGKNAKPFLESLLYHMDTDNHLRSFSIIFADPEHDFELDEAQAQKLGRLTELNMLYSGHAGKYKHRFLSVLKYTPHLQKIYLNSLNYDLGVSMPMLMGLNELRRLFVSGDVILSSQSPYSGLIGLLNKPGSKINQIASIIRLSENHISGFLGEYERLRRFPVSASERVDMIFIKPLENQVYNDNIAILYEIRIVTFKVPDTVPTDSQILEAAKAYSGFNRMLIITSNDSSQAFLIDSMETGYARFGNNIKCSKRGKFIDCKGDRNSVTKLDDSSTAIQKLRSEIPQSIVLNIEGVLTAEHATQLIPSFRLVKSFTFRCPGIVKETEDSLLQILAATPHLERLIIMDRLYTLKNISRLAEIISGYEKLYRLELITNDHTRDCFLKEYLRHRRARSNAPSPLRHLVYSGHLPEISTKEYYEILSSLINLQISIPSGASMNTMFIRAMPSLQAFTLFTGSFSTILMSKVLNHN